MVPNEHSAEKAPLSPEVRLFFAVEVAQEVRAALADLSNRLEKAARFTPARISWVPEDNFHITLFFLGQVSLLTALRLKELLPAATREVSPFELDLRHVGVFPKNENRPPRVLWVGSHDTPQMVQRLRKNCASVIAQAKLPIPDQDFSPHVTIARFRSTAGIGPFTRMLREYEFFKAGRYTVSRVVLMQSITGGGPTRYVPYATADFAQGSVGENP